MHSKRAEFCTQKQEKYPHDTQIEKNAKKRSEQVRITELPGIEPEAGLEPAALRSRDSRDVLII